MILMKLRNIKEWINTKDDWELDKDVAVATHIFPPTEYMLYPQKIGYWSTDEFQGFVFLCLTEREVKLIEENDKLKKELEKNES